MEIRGLERHVGLSRVWSGYPEGVMRYSREWREEEMACPEKVCENCDFAEKSSKRITCSCPAFKYSSPIYGIPEDGLAHWDCEGYFASFAVGPKFGCIHWKPRE